MMPARTAMRICTGRTCVTWARSTRTSCSVTRCSGGLPRFEPGHLSHCRGRIRHRGKAGEGMMTPMNEHELLAEQFEASRIHLRSVAYRMLGSTSEAEDAVQEAWLRLSRS